MRANFASGQSLIKQASSEYSHGQQLQNAASHAKEHADSIDSNLNQAYHDWVVERFGARGEQVMLQADSASIATQNQWASEFFNSSVGHRAVSAQVDSALSNTASDVRADYQSSARLISQSSGIRQQYQRDGQAVDNKASGKGLTPMSDEHLSTAKNIQANHRLESGTGNATSIARIVNYELKGTKKTIDYKKLNKEQ